jgi:uncharacterized membrane protein YkgB
LLLIYSPRWTNTHYTVNKEVNMTTLKGLAKIAIGIAMMIGAIAAEIAWLGVCFGTVVIGVILLFTYPMVLMAPFAFLWFPGWQLLNSGSLDVQEAKL